MSLVSGIFKALFGPKRSEWIDVVSVKAEPGDGGTRVVVTLMHDTRALAPLDRRGMKIRMGVHIAGHPVLIPDAPELVLAGEWVKATDWKSSGDISIESYGAYPEDYDVSGQVRWGHPFDFVFDVPMGLISGPVEARVHYLQYGAECNSSAFKLDLK